MPCEIKIRSVESELIKKVCRHRRRCEVYVSQFQRFGFSGARLLLIYFARKPEGIPYLLRVDDLAKARKEHEAIDTLRDYVADARLAENDIFCASDSEREGMGGAAL